MALRIIATGGTFDKQYDPIRGILGFDDTHLPEILETARLSEPAVLEIVSMIDSLDMGGEQREKILESCRRCPEDRIIIIHGTDTMAETAEIIGAAGLPKCIVLTGAMVPYSVNRSDALFNLGTAVMAAELSGTGTWIAMNGRILPWNQVRKDRERGIFISTRTEESE